MNDAKQKTLGQHLIEGMEEALAHARGARTGAVTKQVPITVRQAIVKPLLPIEGPEIAAIRKRFGVSQPIFANVLGVSSEAVKKWEQGKKSPDGASRRLLEIARDEPAVLLRFIKTQQRPKEAYLGQKGLSSTKRVAAAARLTAQPKLKRNASTTVVARARRVGRD